MKTRVPDEPVDPNLEDDIEDAQHVATEAPPKICAAHVVQQPKRPRVTRNKHTSNMAAQEVSGQGNNDAEGRDEVIAPANLQKDTRKRRSNEDNFPTDSAHSKKAKSDHVQQTEPLEINDKDPQKLAEEKHLKHLAEEKGLMQKSEDKDLETFELDMEIATTRLKNSDVKNGSLGEATITDVNLAVEALKHLQLYGTGSQSSGDGSNTREHIKSATVPSSCTTCSLSTSAAGMFKSKPPAANSMSFSA